jgi:hypothetical protein
MPGCACDQSLQCVAKKDLNEDFVMHSSHDRSCPVTVAASSSCGRSALSQHAGTNLVAGLVFKVVSLDDTYVRFCAYRRSWVVVVIGREHAI